jgi:hypothetical protein
MGKGKRNLDVEEEGLMLGPFRIESHRTWEKSESHALYFSAFGVQFFSPHAYSLEILCYSGFLGKAVQFGQ